MNFDREQARYFICASPVSAIKTSAIKTSATKKNKQITNEMIINAMDSFCWPAGSNIHASKELQAHAHMCGRASNSDRRAFSQDIVQL